MNFAYQGPAYFHDASNDVEAPKAFLQWQWLCRIIIRNHQGQRVWSISTLTPPLSSRPHTMNILACSQIPSCNCAQVLLCALLQRPFSCPLAAMSSSYFLSKSRCSCTPIAETQGKDEASLAGKNLCVSTVVRGHFAERIAATCSEGNTIQIGVFDANTIEIYP